MSVESRSPIRAPRRVAKEPESSSWAEMRKNWNVDMDFDDAGELEVAKAKSIATATAAPAV